MMTALAGLSGEWSAWPTDAEFGAAWQEGQAYSDLSNAKLVHILSRLSNDSLSMRNEQIVIDSPLTVEHILPQNWLEHWPLASGEAGLTHEQLWDAQPDDPRAAATRRRNAALHTFGNLTILTQELNSTVSNSAWPVKKPELLRSSLLPINQQLHEFAVWDEDSIQQRGKALLERALRIWPAADLAGLVRE
jgi:hypothetical protein